MVMMVMVLVEERTNICIHALRPDMTATANIGVSHRYVTHFSRATQDHQISCMIAVSAYEVDKPTFIVLGVTRCLEKSQ